MACSWAAQALSYAVGRALEPESATVLRSAQKRSDLENTFLIQATRQQAEGIVQYSLASPDFHGLPFEALQGVTCSQQIVCSSWLRWPGRARDGVVGRAARIQRGRCRDGLE